MHAEEPSLLDHLQECRGQLTPEGGLSFIIFAGTIRNEADMTEALSVHRKVKSNHVSSVDIGHLTYYLSRYR